MSESNKPTGLFWVIAIIALLWNAMGVFMYLSQQYMSDETLAAMPQNEQDFLNNTPAWVTAAFATAVFAGFIASIGLLMRKKWCVPLFALSFLAIIASHVYSFFMQDDLPQTGAHLVMPIIIIFLGLVFVMFSKKAKRSGILS